jgi:hypothetical protein
MHRPAAALAVLAALVAGTFTNTPAQAAAPRPEISDAQVVHAPIGEKGGIMTPWVSCSTRVEPKARTVMTSLDTDWRRVFEWKGTIPAAGFPRAAVGDYKIRTVARCSGNKKVRTEYVTVEEKTRQRTISRAEFRQIERGMTRVEVREIVGYGGTAAGTSWQGQRLRTYDMMAFWAWVLIEYRDGRVASKTWDIDHD